MNLIGRRAFLIAMGTMLVAPLSHAQQPARLAWIGSGTATGSVESLKAFRGGMTENGLVEGKDYVLDLVWSDGEYGRFPALIDEALVRKPAVILVQTIASVRAAQQATKTIPIVFMSTNDPVGAGLVSSLARPGGMTTGLATMNEDRAAKLVQFVHEFLPKARRIAVFINPLNPSNRPIFETINAAASKLGMIASAIEASSPKQVDDAFHALSATRPDALVVGFDATLTDQRGRIAPLAMKYKIPLFSSALGYADAGALLSFGVPAQATFGRAAVYVKRILTGTKPADLPVEQPTTFELVINLKTATALGIKVPQSIMLQATKVIE